ncbi:IclR family transcriptional regulator [Streptomyces sp. WAC 06738]|uniref:IclR family transcriptional regulator n=1 Tax=Streptomyces sp. WAC 06738 TaxID=2203210 RepID=UPI000F6F859F|nr:IclR family transcriptional regulator C-terminal domain-containing protein [Streptomyces sp. WAC 06738]AZM46218.1 IclR family transcriptional regulator [Streptomyces sp. WAC 06738]
MPVLHPPPGDQPPGRRPEPRDEPAAPFPSVRHALRVLESAARHGGEGVPVARLARETGLPPGRLAHLLLTLRRQRYLERLEDGSYAIGEAVALLGAGGSRTRAVHDKLRREMNELRKATRAAIYLGRYEDGEVRVTQIADAPGTPRVNEWVDFRSAAHATALGKCLLTQLDHDARRDHLSRHRAARLTSRTITSEAAVLAALDRQVATVPTLDLQEYAVGTVCAAVPLTAGLDIGCVALSLPVNQTHRLRAAAERLNREAANLLLALSL